MRRLPIAAASLVLIATGPAAAAPGDLDPSFGTGGRLFVEGILGGLGEDGTGLSSLSILADGRIVLLGTERCSLSCDPILVVSRRTPAGAPDPTLIAGPSLGVLAVPGHDDGEPESTRILGSALQRDGGLVVGRARTGASSLVAYGPDGTPVAPVPSAAPVTPDAVLPDGRVLGRSGRTVLRLTPALAPDPSFGAGRAVVIPAGLRTPLPVIRSGRGVVSGSDTARGLALWRTDGNATTPATVSTLRIPANGPGAVSGLTARQVVAARGGRTILVGAAIRTQGFAPTALLTRFDSSGRADAGFGRDGLLRLSGREPAVVVDEAGRIVVATLAGRAPVPGAEVRVIVRRLGPRGAPDPAFPARILRIGRGYAAGLGVSIDPRGRIVVGVGFSPQYTRGGVVLHRLRGGPPPR
ncbi:MAG: hypothetical protein JHC74_15590 [Thermoleophilia bacterium]|nr:hypothetical protein [Thermoleophilia bacterium]